VRGIRADSVHVTARKVNILHLILVDELNRVRFHSKITEIFPERRGLKFENGVEAQAARGARIKNDGERLPFAALQVGDFVEVRGFETEKTGTVLLRIDILENHQGEHHGRDGGHMVSGGGR
jgi:hypothetical protein